MNGLVVLSSKTTDERRRILLLRLISLTTVPCTCDNLLLLNFEDLRETREGGEVRDNVCRNCLQNDRALIDVINTKGLTQPYISIIAVRSEGQLSLRGGEGVVRSRREDGRNERRGGAINSGTVVYTPITYGETSQLGSPV